MQLWRYLPTIGLLLLSAYVTGAEPPGPVEFNRDVRPILSDHCFQCHGPDAAQRKGDLRLDVEPKPNGEHGSLIVPGQPEKSELWRRVNSTDPDERMPPPRHGRGLSENERAVLRNWITAGGKFEKHWSLLPINRPSPPQIQHSGFILQNSIDSFIAQKLITAGLPQSAPADKPTVLRRVTFALTGLPPSINEIETFLADDSPDAYEKTVDRLLASPRYGERLAVPWLDAARYADTSGYQSDGERHMWRWRDWVLHALNTNMPFNQFTIEQIAGDLLPNATLDQKIATGFNRNHRGNAEGGIIPEEYAAEYVADRVETTSTVWLGLTLGCCRCHDHKYDPFTQKDFYSLFAFFNNVPEKGRAIKIGNSPPFIAAPTRQQAEELQKLEQNADFKPRNSAELFHAFLKWEQNQKGRAGDWHPKDLLIGHVSFDSTSRPPDGNDSRSRLPDGTSTNDVSNNSEASPPTPPRQTKPSAKGNESRSRPPDGTSTNQLLSNSETAQPTHNPPSQTAGILGQAGQFHGEQYLELPKVGDFGFFDKFTLSAWINVKPGDGGTIISHMVDEPHGEGYQLAIVDGKLQFNLSKRWLDDALRVETADKLLAGTWRHVVATYDGSRAAEGVKLYVDGEPWKLNVLLDELNQTFATKEPLRIGAGGGKEARFQGAIDDVRVYGRALPIEEVQALATPQTLDQIFAIENSKRTAGQMAKLQFAFLEDSGPEEVRAAYKNYKAAERELTQFREKLPTVMVMEEMANPRQTHVLLRGQYDKPGDRVTPNTPAELPPLPSSTPHSALRVPHSSAANRLDLARWLVSQTNPLTARVIVNRAWQLHFGTGLVKTSEDFGRQGEWPSHPDLLNHLAAEFQTNWNVKRLHRTIVTSATFRQSSSAELGMRKSESGASAASAIPHSALRTPHSSDPDNRLLSRGPRLRLSAEMVRDQALFASGELLEQLGGPSVKPLQPPGLWSELTGGDDYKPGAGPDLVRRSLYTFWKRTIPPPTLSTFDSPTREACTVRESRTNTPLQALALLNEPTFVTASRVLAHRLINEAKTPSDRITQATLYILNRPPTPPELTILTTSLNRNLQQHSTNELAAYTLLCTTIFNLDEAITSQ